MNSFESSLTILALLLLGLLLPLLMTLIYGWSMDRLLAHWNTDLEHQGCEQRHGSQGSG
jgi:hypothetical protein